VAPQAPAGGELNEVAVRVADVEGQALAAGLAAKALLLDGELSLRVRGRGLTGAAEADQSGGMKATGAIGLVWLAAAAAGAQESVPDLTRLPVGDGRVSWEPRVGHVWACRIDPQAGGAFRDGPWIRGDGTFDFTAKAVVDGRVTWPSRWRIVRQGDRRRVTANDLPSHPTGTFPIARDDDAWRYDRNPNRIAPQDLDFDLPVDPVPAPRPSCAPGAVGILLSGSVLFSALDAPGRDAVAHETQDGCQGHPQRSGVYHYHSLTTCLEEGRLADGHSALVGYALDGFGIFGRHGEGGRPLGSSDLDECHGHSHAVPWDGAVRVIYHYHATWDFPYTVGCLRGAWRREDMLKISGAAAGPPPKRRDMAPQ
jgi:hypothetical protein